MNNISLEDIMFKRLSGKPVNFGYVSQKERLHLVNLCVKYGILKRINPNADIFKVTYCFHYKEMRSMGVCAIGWDEACVCVLDKGKRLVL